MRFSLLIGIDLVSFCAADADIGSTVVLDHHDQQHEFASMHADTHSSVGQLSEFQASPGAAADQATDFSACPLPCSPLSYEPCDLLFADSDEQNYESCL